MAYDGTTPYEVGGNKVSDQGEASTANRGGGTLQMRILVELQVISYILAQAYELNESLQQIRQDLTDEIT